LDCKIYVDLTGLKTPVNISFARGFVKPPRAFARGFPVRKKNIFYIAPLDPALPDGACGEQAGQGLTLIIY